jgi:hypothetical protein
MHCDGDWLAQMALAHRTLPESAMSILIFWRHIFFGSNPAVDPALGYSSPAVVPGTS